MSLQSNSWAVEEPSDKPPGGFFFFFKAFSDKHVCADYRNLYPLWQITLTLKDIVTMTREKTARLIPNAIQVCTSTEKVDCLK